MQDPNPALYAVKYYGFEQILPEIVLACGFLLILTLQIFRRKRIAWLMPALAGLAIAVALGCLFMPRTLHPMVSDGSAMLHFPDGWAFSGMISADGLSDYIRLILYALAIPLLYMMTRDPETGLGRRKGGEYYMLFMVMLIGMSLMSMANNLMMVYLSTEMVSIPAYLLAAYSRDRQKSAEAGTKYVIYGAFSSAVMLYGISWLYGLTGHLDLYPYVEPGALSQADPNMVGFALLFVLGGFAFKIGALPFHFWAPDVYEGAPWSSTLVFATLPKVAAFGMLARLSDQFAAGPELALRVQLILGLMALGSMLLGTLAALRQENFRRMLAWSAVAQSGFILLGFTARTPEGTVAGLYYVAVYALVTFGAFLCAWFLQRHSGSENISDYRGMAGNMPGLTVALTLFMAALTGLPPTAGFIAKLEVFSGLIGQPEGHPFEGLFVILLVAAVISAVVSLYFYMRTPVMMAFRNPVIKTGSRLHGSDALWLAICGLPVLVGGIWGFDLFINYLHTILP